MIKICWLLVLIALIGIGLWVYKPVGVLNALITRKGYALHQDIIYGTLPSQNMDIYVPDQLSTPHTTIVFFYGGSWQSGSKDIYRFLGQALASKGFITVVPNYRYFPEVYFPTFMDDAAKAVGWVHANIQKYGGDSKHVFLMGHSAGAHIAALLMTDGQFFKAQGVDPAWVSGMIGLAGPYDFLPFTDPNVKELFSKVKDSETQPINFVKKGLAPFLLLTGKADTQVYPKNTINFANRLRENQVPVTEIIYPRIGHIGIILSTASWFHFLAPTLDDISGFVGKVNEKQPSQSN